MKQHEMPQFPKSYWHDSVNIERFPALDESVKVDVGIVGGGITGITTAYLLSKTNLKVALIEAGELLNGTTGHTTAKITAQHGLIYDEYINHFGEEKTALYYAANNEAKQLIKQIIEQHDIECYFQEQDAYLYTNADDYIKKLENEEKAYEKLDIDYEMSDQMPLDLPLKSVLVMKNQAQFHPLKYLKVLIEKCKENGVQIYENTTASSVEFSKHPTIITTDRKRITCRHVVQATHFPFYDGEGYYPTRMYADRSYVLAAKMNQPFPGGMYKNAETPSRSVRSNGSAEEELWIIGGESHKTGQGISTYKHYEALQQFAEQHFEVESFVYRWSAQDLITLDKLPYIGPVTQKQHSVLVATGFRKWGMTNSTIAAKIFHDMITEKENPYRELYTPSRFQADPSLKKFVKINADVTKHLIKGKLEYTDSNLEDIKPDDAKVVRINGKRAGVYKDEDNNLHVVDTTCRHLGCEVEWNSGDRTWDCPCHGSRYTIDGDVVEGPAKEPLIKIDIHSN